MKNLNSLILFLWLLFPTLLLFSSCMSQYSITVKQLDEHSDFSLIGMKLKTGKMIECNNNDLVKIIDNNKVEFKDKNGKTNLITFDDIESLQIKKLNTTMTIGIIAFIVLIIVVIKFVYKPNVVGDMKLFGK